MTRAALIDGSNKVVNVIALGPGFTPPPGHVAIETDVANIGDAYEGGVFVPPPQPEQPPSVPQSVSKAQACVALYLTASPVNPGKTLLDDVEAAVAAVGGITAIWWREAKEVERDSATLAQLAAALGIPAEQIDALFLLAAQQSS